MDWISVEDRLPEKSSIMPLCPISNPAPKRCGIIVHTSQGRVFETVYSVMGFANLRFKSGEKVTHWMPLPDPPKDEA